MIPGSANPLLLKSAAAGGYQVERSLRFSSSDSAFCSRTPAVAGNRRTWTWAGWVKRSKLGAEQNIFGCMANDVSFYTNLTFEVNDKIYIYDSLTANGRALVTTQLFRDPSAWFHIILHYNTTDATNSNKAKLYINGTEVTQFDEDNRSYLTSDASVNRAAEHNIGKRNYSPAPLYLDGYLADIHFIDGQALTPSSFTEVSATTGQLVPIAYTGGSYGTNGFYLQFADNSAATAATLGADTSGNGNNWTPNNFITSPGGPTPVSYGRTANSGSDAPSPAQGTPTYASGSDIILNPSDTSGDGDFQNTRVLGFQNITGVTTLRVLRVAGTSDAKLGFNGTLSTVGAFGSFSFPATIGQAAWYTVTSPPSTLTSMAIAGGGSGGSNQHQVYRIEVNGVELYDVYAAADNDSLVDTPTSYGTDTGAGGSVRGNYCTLNPLKLANVSLSNGNLDWSDPSSDGKALGTIGMSSGKWYWECTLNGANTLLGIAKDSTTLTASPGYDANSWAYSAPSGNKVTNSTSSAYGNVSTTGDVVGVAFDADAGNLYFYKNGTIQNSGTEAFTGLTSGPYLPSVGNTFGSGTMKIGQSTFA